MEESNKEEHITNTEANNGEGTSNDNIGNETCDTDDLGDPPAYSLHPPDLHIRTGSIDCLCEPLAS